MNISSAERKLHEKLFEIEAQIVESARDLRILSAIQWPRAVINQFLEDWRAGRPRIPEVQLTPPEGLDTLVERMAHCMKDTPREHPLGDVIWKTAWSYSTAAQMLQSMGTPAFTERSIELYGRPDRSWENQKFSDLSAAEFMLRTSSDLMQSCAVPSVDGDTTAEQLAERLRARIARVFKEDPIEVELSPDLASKAAASSKRVRWRISRSISALPAAPSGPWGNHLSL
jgi:hypothetical protein